MTTLEQKMRDLSKGVDDLRHEVHGPKIGADARDRSVRGRLHYLEGVAAGAKLLANAKVRRLSTWERMVLTSVAVLMAVVSTLSLVYQLRGGK